MSYFTPRVSIHGRRLAISTTGGLVMGVGTTSDRLVGSSDVNIAAQMWGPGMMKTLAAANGVTVPNSGTTVLGAGCTNGSSLFLAAPVPGVRKRFYALGCTASAVTLVPAGGATIYVTSSGGGLGGSTTVNLVNSTYMYTYAELTGLSTAVWAVTSRSTVGVST